MRFVQRALWVGFLAILALRVWVLDLVIPARILLVQWIGLGLGLAWWISQRGWHQRLPRQLAVPCGVLLLAYLLSALRSQDRLEALLQGQSLVLGILFCTGVALATDAKRRQLLGVLAITGMVLTISALRQVFFVFPAYHDFPWSALTTEAHVAEFATQVITRGRAFGPFPLPALLAGAMGILLPVSIVALTPWAVTPWRRVVALLLWALQAIGLWLTQSLGGIVALAAATLLVLTVRHSPWSQRLAVLGIAIVAIELLLAMRPELVSLDHPRNPIMQRWRYWHSTAEMIHDHPLVGIGAGNYAVVYPRYQHPKATQTRFAHNVWLHIWAEWGFLGLLGIVGLCLGSIRLLTSQPKGVQTAVWAFWILASIDITWSVFQVAGLWWPLLGLLSPPPSQT